MNKHRYLYALNRAFEKAFAHTVDQEAVTDLITCLGEELECDRISVFEIHDDGFFDNTYEWCREGVVSELDFLQHLPYDTIGSWKNRLREEEQICIGDLEKIREEDPDLYMLFAKQQVRSLIVSTMSFHGESRGFFVLENPPAEMIEEADDIMPGMRYILASLVYSDHLIQRLRKVGYSDSLTGSGNRLSLQSFLESLDRNRSVGIVYCGVLEWDVADGHLEHLEEEQMLIHASDVLKNVMNRDQVFRVDSGEFIAISSGQEKQDFTETVSRLRTLFLEKDLVVAVGMVWSPNCDSSFDALIRRARLYLYDEKRQISRERKSRKFRIEAGRALRNLQEKADISMYHADEFLHKAESWVGQIFDENILTFVIDINYFKLYNDIFGRKAGNVFLESLADNILRIARERHGLAGYMGGDDFCLMLPTMSQSHESILFLLEEMARSIDYPDGFAPAIGAYFSANRYETAVMMYDRALAALAEIKGSYTERYRLYNEDHFQNVRDSKLMLLDAKKGLDNEEFTFYVQPQVHEKSGKIVGVEALIRWNKNGVVREPGSFIDSMEKSGYIFSLDSCIWEQVCIWLRSLLDRGLKPVPCSVNVSRMDFYFTDIAKHFKGLIQEYDLDPALLGIEITETAFTDNMESIEDVIEELHEAGFVIYMDDFGRGSSSLTMLHRMNVDRIKMDVQFMSQSQADNRAISIVESIISMAHMMGMLIIAEGVETQQQRDELIVLGDNYAQGFFFYKPMPVEEFEKILADPEKIGEPPGKKNMDSDPPMQFRDMIHKGILSESLLDNIIGPSAVYRATEDSITIVQMNDAFSRLTGITQDDQNSMDSFVRRFYNGSEKLVQALFQDTGTHLDEGCLNELDFTRADGVSIHLKLRLYLLYSLDDHKLFMSIIQE